MDWKVSLYNKVLIIHICIATKGVFFKFIIVIIIIYINISCSNLFPEFSFN